MSRGCAVIKACGSKPRRFMTPGRKASTKTSALAAKARAASQLSELGGKTYYFCNPTCKNSFDRAPQQFLPRQPIEPEVFAQPLVQADVDLTFAARVNLFRQFAHEPDEARLHRQVDAVSVGEVAKGTHTSAGSLADVAPACL